MGVDFLPKRDSSRKVFKIPVTLHPKQMEVDRNPARFKIVRAGRKFGKTTYAQKKALDWMSPPTSVVWFIAPYLKQAKMISWTEFKRLIPVEALAKKPNDVDLTITIKNGSQLFLMGSDDPDSLRGPAPNGVIFDEAAFHRKEAWAEVVAPNLMPKKAPALFITTPKGYNWFKDLEDEALKDIRSGNTDWAVYHFSVYDNPYIDKAEIERMHRQCDNEQIWRQEYLAEYESSVGRVFSSFDDKLGGRHVRSIDVPRGSFECFRSIDWGIRDNTACLWGFLRGGRLMVYREYLGNNLGAPEQAKIIKNMTKPNEKVARTAISHDAAKEDPTKKGLTVLWHFRQSGIENLQPSTRDKQHSRAMLNQLFQQDRIVIDPNGCPKLRKQLLSYEWKDTAMERVEDSGDDDAVDSLHYMVEMLQFELFMDHKKESTMSMTDIYSEIAKERLRQWKNPRTELPNIFLPPEDMGSVMEDTSAGYF